MYIVLAAATLPEIRSTAEWLDAHKLQVHGHDVDILLTGVGGVQAAYTLSRKLSTRRPGLIMQAGIGGSFSGELAPGSLAVVKEEVLADLGAIGQEGFEDIFDLGLAGRDEQPFTNGLLKNPQSGYWQKLGLPMVRGATINCVSSMPAQVAMFRQKYEPVLETMEGAALHYVCLMENIPFVQLRAVSNAVGERNKANWDIPGAVSNLNILLKDIFARLDDFPAP